MTVFENILKLKEATVFVTAYVVSFGTKPGVGGGVFVWKEDINRNTILEIPGMVVFPVGANAPGAGAWVRKIPNGNVSPEMYGAHGDDTDEIPDPDFQAYYGTTRYQTDDNWDTVAHETMFQYAEEEQGANRRRVVANGVYNYTRGVKLPREEKKNRVTTGRGAPLSFKYTGGHHKKAPSSTWTSWIHDTGDNPDYGGAFSTTYISNQYTMSEMTYEGSNCHGLRLSVSYNSIVENCTFIDLDHALLFAFCLNAQAKHIDLHRITGRGIVMSNNRDPLQNFNSCLFFGPPNSGNCSGELGSTGNDSSISYVSCYDLAPTCKHAIFIRMLNLCSIDHVYIKGDQPIKRAIDFNILSSGGPVWGINIENVLIDMPAGFSDAAIVIKARGPVVVKKVTCLHACIVFYGVKTAGGAPKFLIEEWGYIHPNCQFVHASTQQAVNPAYIGWRDIPWIFKANHPSLQPETTHGNFPPATSASNFWNSSITPLHGTGISEDLSDGGTYYVHVPKEVSVDGGPY